MTFEEKCDYYRNLDPVAWDLGTQRLEFRIKILNRAIKRGGIDDPMYSTRVTKMQISEAVLKLKKIAQKISRLDMLKKQILKLEQEIHHETLPSSGQAHGPILP